MGLEDDLRVVREAFDAWERWDADGVIAHMSEDCTYMLPRNLVDGGLYSDRDALRGALADAQELWKSIRIEIESAEIVNDRLVFDIVQSNTPRVGPGPLRSDLTYAAEIRDGKVSWLRIFQTRGEAVAAAEAKEPA